MKLLLLAAGGATGALLRYVITGWTCRIYAGDMPWGTITVNIIGSFAIGLLSGVFEKVAISPNMKSLLFIGVLGAFTTFSAYSLESFNLFRDGQVKYAVINIVASNIAALTMVFAGFFVSRYILSFMK